MVEFWVLPGFGRWQQYFKLEKYSTAGPENNFIFAHDKQNDYGQNAGDYRCFDQFQILTFGKKSTKSSRASWFFQNRHPHQDIWIL